MIRKVWPICLCPLLAGCLSAGQYHESYRLGLQPGQPPVGVVFVANGAGDYRTVSRNVCRAVAETFTPLQVESFVWTVGRGRYILDQINHDNHIEQGRRLAAQVWAYRAAYPERRIYLIGHSAGCAVVLAAAELLPPDSLSRIILLSPSVCDSYDLRPALRAARGGIDNFLSAEDRWILGLGVRIVGTTERRCRQAAGHSGFTPVIETPADAALYERLRQHPWDPVVEWSGHRGGHFGNHDVGFLRAYVLPLLAE